MRHRGKQFKSLNDAAKRQKPEQQVSTVDNRELDSKDSALAKAYGSLYESKNKTSKVFKSGKENIDLSFLDAIWNKKAVRFNNI